MITRRHFIMGLLIAPFLARARDARTQTPLALEGYDPVAYFTDGLPRQGAAEHAMDWNGMRWHFASRENRAMFKADPTRYAPQFGGYCAWAVAQGYLAPIDPTAWAIVDDRLYLNFNARIQRRWERDIPGFITAARANWPGLQSN